MSPALEASVLAIDDKPATKAPTGPKPGAAGTQNSARGDPSSEADAPEAPVGSGAAVVPDLTAAEIEEVAPAPQVEFAEFADGLANCLLSKGSCFAVGFVRDDYRGRARAEGTVGTVLEKRDVSQIDALMRDALARVGEILGETDSNGTASVFSDYSTQPVMFALWGTRRGQPAELIWSPVEAGGFRFNIVMSVDAAVSDRILMNRLHSCIACAVGQ